MAVVGELTADQQEVLAFRLGRAREQTADLAAARCPEEAAARAC
jgi:hypothetical protein